MDPKEILSAVSIIPESAPFNATQRAWLNGFFAGMTGINETAAHSDDSQGASGSTPAVAEPEVEEDFPWHDDSLSIDERLELAKDRPVNRQMMAAMAQLDCGSCGYLCKTYSEAIASGEETNLTLCTPGGKETAKALKQLVRLNASEGASQDQPASATKPKSNPPEPGYSRQSPVFARLIRSEKITCDGSSKDVRHVEIDLAECKLNYEVGDALGIYPTNCNDLVDEVLSHCIGDMDIDEARELLSTLDLAQATDELCEMISEFAEAEIDRERIQSLMEDDDRRDELDVLDVLQLFDSVRICEKRLIACLPNLVPRLYSIASSINKHPEQVHLTVGKVSYTKGERLRKGVASTMVAERMEIGAQLKVFMQKSHGFRIPENDQTPMIMVGPGTGIAPFIGFLQEREVRGAKGDNWLFFGDQRSETDFLYQEQLQNYLDNGQLTRLDTAFSRDQDHKVYVQDRMRENAEALFEWLERGASFYVCGDASRMAKDVDRVLHEIIEQHGGMTTEQAKEFVKKLKTDGRYLRDVY